MKLKFIKYINILKPIKNIIISDSNFKFIEKNLLTDLTLLNKTNSNIFFLKNNTKVFNSKLIIEYTQFKTTINSYINTSVELLILLRYRDSFFKKLYTNYDLSMLYSLSLINSDVESVFDLDDSSIINIRKPFKASNSTLIRRTGLIDAILKKYIEKTLDTKVSINFDKYNLCFLRKKSIFLRILRRRMQRINRLLKHSDLTLRNFIRITFIFMCTKDLDLFSKILLKTLNSMHYKNHRRFLYYLKLFITKSMNFYFDVLKFEGFFFYLSGKISGGGNSKKNIMLLSTVNTV